MQDEPEARPASAPPQPVRLDARVTVDTVRQECRVDGEDAGLTSNEYRLLTELVMRRGAYVRGAALSQLLLGRDDLNTLKVTMFRLRAKLAAWLGEDGARQLLGSDKNRGYRIPLDDELETQTLEALAAKLVVSVPENRLYIADGWRRLGARRYHALQALVQRPGKIVPTAKLQRRLEPGRKLPPSSVQLVMLGLRHDVDSKLGRGTGARLFPGRPATGYRLATGVRIRIILPEAAP